MSKPILYGTNVSPPVRTVLLTTKAIGLEYEFREVDLLAGGTLKPEFLAMNPQHTVPTLRDGDEIIWDSHAIATYLIDKYAKDDSLYPKDLIKRARINQRLYFDSEILFVRLRNIVGQVLYDNNPVIPQEKLDAWAEGYDFMEKFLVKDLYMVGDSVTLADFSCISSVTSLQGVYPVDPQKYPKLAAWMKRMEELPYYQEQNGVGAKAFIDFVTGKIKELSKK